MLFDGACNLHALFSGDGSTRASVKNGISTIQTIWVTPGDHSPFGIESILVLVQSNNIKGNCEKH